MRTNQSSQQITTRLKQRFDKQPITSQLIFVCAIMLPQTRFLPFVIVLPRFHVQPIFNLALTSMGGEMSRD